MMAIRNFILSALASALILNGFAIETEAQRTTTRRTTNSSDRQMRDLIRRIRVQSDNFKNSFDEAIQRVRLRGTENQNVSRDIEDFERAVADFETRFNGRDASSADAQTVLDEAADINRFLGQTRLGTRVDRDWTALRGSLNELAREYNLSANWTGNYGSNYPNAGSNYPNDNRNFPRDNRNFPNDNRNFPTNSGFGTRLNGTFQLDFARSDNPSDLAERAVAGLSAGERESARTLLQQRLEAPERIAIEQRGRQIAIASSRAPRYSFEADGRDKFETGENGRQLRVRASLAGERLEVSTSGDRGNDYVVSFEPQENGRTLRVERRLYADFLRQPVVVQSYYTKTDDVARLDIYENPGNFPANSGSPNRNNDYIIRNGEVLTATLNESVSTKAAQDRHRFSMTVETPDQFRGAIIEGYISNISRSGKVTGRAQLTFNFETIRTRDGRVYNFAGFVESIRTTDGDAIKVDNEGTARGENQGKTTATRGAIGAGVGAIIGAIAGGAKGAAIGAILGGGAGAGSVYIEGREDLELQSGSQVSIRASAPERRRN